MRGTFEDTEFRRNYPSKIFTDLRSRFNIEVATSDRVKIFLQFQDSRRLGEVTKAGERTSGTLDEPLSISAHQAYITISDFPVKGLSFKGGRFEASFGNERLFGRDDWNNTGRAFDGLMLEYDSHFSKVSVFDLKLVESKLLDRTLASEETLLGGGCRIQDIGASSAEFSGV